MSRYRIVVMNDDRVQGEVENTDVYDTMSYAIINHIHRETEDRAIEPA